MRILYVTPCWSALGDLASGASSAPRGMPAFFRPLQRLQEEGHTIDFVIGVSPEQPSGFRGDLFGRTARVETIPWIASGLARTTSIFRGARTISRTLRESDYDFVYGHGAMGALGCWVARRHGVRTGLRLYGVNKYSERATALPRWRFACRYPLLYEAFRGQKDFLVATDDGSRANILVDRFRPSEDSYAFRLWRNGADLQAPLSSPTASREPLLFCPGRIAPKKQQHLCVELLHRLHAAGHTELRLAFAGHVNDPSYRDRLDALAVQLGVHHAVDHLGVLDRDGMQEAFGRCLAVLSFQQVSNLSNVCIEALAAGAVVVAPDDGSLEGIVADGTSGLLTQDLDDAARRVGELVDDPDLAARLGREAQRSVRRAFRSWDERAEDEVALIAGRRARDRAA